MADQRSQKRITRVCGRIWRFARVPGALLILAFVVSEAGIAQCTEKPTVWMGEHTASSHLLAGRNFVFPAKTPVLAHIRSVIVRVTVNRKGKICEAKATAGPMQFREAAEKVVKTSWRYRPFLLDRKPVVVQFPVTLNFLLSADKDVKTLEVTEVFHFNSSPFQVSSETPRT